MSASRIACRSASSERSPGSSKPRPWNDCPCWPAKPDWSRKSASLSSSDWRSTASAISGENLLYVWKRMGGPPPSLIPPDAPECHRPPSYIGIVTAPATINPFRVALRHRNFRLFWIGQTLSLIGTWMQTMAQGWLALDLTNSAFLVGLVATASSIPILL